MVDHATTTDATSASETRMHATLRKRATVLVATTALALPVVATASAASTGARTSGDPQVTVRQVSQRYYDGRSDDLAHGRPGVRRAPRAPDPRSPTPPSPARTNCALGHLEHDGS